MPCTGVQFLALCLLILAFWLFGRFSSCLTSFNEFEFCFNPSQSGVCCLQLRCIVDTNHITPLPKSFSWVSLPTQPCSPLQPHTWHPHLTFSALSTKCELLASLSFTLFCAGSFYLTISWDTPTLQKGKLSLSNVVPYLPQSQNQNLDFRVRPEILSSCRWNSRPSFIPLPTIAPSPVADLPTTQCTGAYSLPRPRHHPRPRLRPGSFLALDLLSFQPGGVVTGPEVRHLASSLALRSTSSQSVEIRQVMKTFCASVVPPVKLGNKHVKSGNKS